MIKLTKVTIHKYKSIENEQVFDVENGITVLVGMNESGKTSILEALAKVNYFEEDRNFKYDITHDYPRKQKKAVDRSGKDPDAVTLTYEIDDELAKTIKADTGVMPSSRSFTVTKKYTNGITWRVNMVSDQAFVAAKSQFLAGSCEFIAESLKVFSNGTSFDELVKSISSESGNDSNVKDLQTLKKYFINPWENHPIDGYIVSTYLSPNLPKFIYYDDYYMLPSQIELEEIREKEELDSSEKTAKALLELADINVEKITNNNDFEDIISELEATQLIISGEVFKYWSTNKNLKIQFNVKPVENKIEVPKTINGRTNTIVTEQIISHILYVRVLNQRSGVSLPLANRSKGFNWFFSFLVWFKKIQEDKKSTYILLLDEPGLNLHAKAQHDLLAFLYDLSKVYQIVYTTHSPFMIETENLPTVRTVVEKDDGTHISNSVQEKDPNTLFPLQAALGYDLAQNLFVSPKNLLVEGIADLVYLGIISDIMKEKNKEALKEDVTIVPVGGADKVATFVSLLRGNKLKIVCLLDTFSDQKSKARLDNQIKQNIIKGKNVLFYSDILENAFADVEDLFEASDYLLLYNGAFGTKIEEKDIDKTKPIVKQFAKYNDDKDYNHYSPANYLARNVNEIALSDVTLSNFEKLFKKINILL